MMNLMHWRLMLAVADAGNITHAAAEVGMTQSGASQAIANLEDMLGAPLFTRERRQTLPTALGLRVADEARTMLDALGRIQSIAQDARGVARSTLRLASFPMVFSTILPPVLRRFRQLHPAFEVVSLEASDDEVEALLAAGAVDAGVVLNPAPDRHVCPLGQDEWMAVLPAAHPLARAGNAIDLAELAAQPFVLATGGCSVHAQSVAQDAGIAIADVRATVQEWSSAFTLVREGLGVSLVPALTLPDNRRGLRVLRLATPLFRSFALAASEEAADSAPVLALFSMLRSLQDDGVAPAG
ncbi:LysR family transcriptional regulator [Achromobacter piechaudii]|uniref:HTH-type transcriptional regulator CynR n=1 Tax=Achromobacter piechaudii TaxID=72556 RepID=A0ABN7EXX2_9BURK|nr:LysR family transcriptional regulator [Achromobacter piechaudii]CAB3691576.1 HTH-type transcriptional regulator CynR [Achromobacter piechaudii]CAB3861144.1 HTH-type transcriptional regulator CynR [Achromobacter piechaudii]CAB3949523.1 HTH-type transcriptional regulator CynR [Achromobacter piechaudii]